MGFVKRWDNKRVKEEKAQAAQALFEQEQRAVAEALEKANREAKAAKDEAERDEIFKLLSEAGDESGFYAKRRRSMSKDSMSEGTRFAEERTRPQSIETEMINSLISSKSRERLRPENAKQTSQMKKRATGPSANAQSQLPNSPQTSSQLTTHQSRRQLRASTGSMKPMTQEEVRRISSVKDAPAQASNSDVLEQVKQKLREQKERDAKKEASLKAREAERTAMAAAYAKEAAPESTRASPAAIKGKAKAVAKAAGGVFLEKTEYSALLSRIRLLEAEVASLSRAAAAIESPQVEVEPQVELVEPDRSLSPGPSRFSPFNKASLAKMASSISPSLLRATPQPASCESGTIRSCTSSSHWNGPTA